MKANGKGTSGNMIGFISSSRPITQKRNLKYYKQQLRREFNQKLELQKGWQGEEMIPRYLDPKMSPKRQR